MTKYARILKQEKPEIDLYGGADERALSNARLRDELKAHLNWCAYLGASVDEESLVNLAQLLRRTARTMRNFAEQAEQCAAR